MATITSAIRKLEKNEYKVEKVGHRFSARQEGSNQSIEIIPNGGDYSDNIAVIVCRRDGNEDDVYSDYHAGTFADNITQAIRMTSIA